MPPVPEKCPSLYTERCPSLSHSAKVMAVSRGSQLEPVIIGHAPHFSRFLNGPPPMRSRQTLRHPGSALTTRAPICAECCLSKPSKSFALQAGLVGNTRPPNGRRWPCLMLLRGFLHSLFCGELAKNTKFGVTLIMLHGDHGSSQNLIILRFTEGGKNSCS